MSGSAIYEKLYSPLEFYRHNPHDEERNGEYGMYDLYDDRYRIGHDEAWEHMDAIELTMRRERDRLDKVRGLAEYVPVGLRGKILSVFPAVELFEAELYFEATVEASEPLTADEMADLKDWWAGQLSDGFGEGLEQREIPIGGGEELYIVPWTSDGGKFFVDTEPEFRQRLGLPSLNFAMPPASFENPPQPVKTPRELLAEKLDAELAEYQAEPTPEELVERLRARPDTNFVAVFGDRERVLANDGYELAGDAPAKARAPERARKSGYVSVLAAMDKAERERRSRPPAPTRDKSRANDAAEL
ncbi:MAG: hypothetical protein LBK41_07565 [Clostridiales bacterium]|jgi:hypothetical protein|nr:hypothetical protein [Clostridiales bacterium]